jgi:hypothetical protein
MRYEMRCATHYATMLSHSQWASFGLGQQKDDVSAVQHSGMVGMRNPDSQEFQCLGAAGPTTEGEDSCDYGPKVGVHCCSCQIES